MILFGALRRVELSAYGSANRRQRLCEAATKKRESAFQIPDPGHEDLGLGEVGGEAVNEEARGGGKLCHRLG